MATEDAVTFNTVNGRRNFQPAPLSANALGNYVISPEHTFDARRARDVLLPVSAVSNLGFLGPWDATITYAERQTVAYQGCLYTSLQAGNLNQIPNAAMSTWWIKVSAAKSSKVYQVDNLTGSDQTALNTCVSTPYATLDAAITQANIDNPAGGYRIELAYNPGTQYPLSVPLTAGDVALNMPSRPNDDATCPIVIPANYTITSNLLDLANVHILCESLLDEPAIIAACRFTYFNDCRFQKSNSLGSLIKITQNPLLALPTRHQWEDCIMIPSNNAQTILIDDSDNVFINGSYLTSRRSIAFSVTDRSTTPNRFTHYSENDQQVFYLEHANMKIFCSNTDVRTFTSTADSPVSVSFSGAQLKSVTKTGTADYSFVDMERLSVGTDTLVQGALYSIIRTAGPTCNYITGREYFLDEVVFHAGESWKCIIDNTFDIEPTSVSANWVQTSSLTSTKNFIVDSLLGDDTKALASGTFPFLTLDACLTQANTINPSGLYSIELINNGVGNDYPLTQDITNDNVTIYMNGTENFTQQVPKTSRITVANVLTISGDDSTFLNLYFEFQSVVDTHTLILTSRYSHFEDCLFSRTVFHVKMLLIIGTPVRHAMRRCDFQNNDAGIWVDDSLATFTGSPSLTLKDWVSGALNIYDQTITPAAFRYFLSNIPTIYIRENNAGLFSCTEMTVAAVVSTADSPAKLAFNRCSVSNITKTGTADYSFADCFRGTRDTDILALGVVQNFEARSGPRTQAYISEATAAKTLSILDSYVEFTGAGTLTLPDTAVITANMAPDVTQRFLVGSQFGSIVLVNTSGTDTFRKKAGWTQHQLPAIGTTNEIMLINASAGPYWTLPNNVFYNLFADMSTANNFGVTPPQSDANQLPTSTSEANHKTLGAASYITFDVTPNNSAFCYPSGPGNSFSITVPGAYTFRVEISVSSGAAGAGDFLLRFDIYDETNAVSLPDLYTTLEGRNQTGSGRSTNLSNSGYGVTGTTVFRARMSQDSVNVISTDADVTKVHVIVEGGV